MTTDDWEQRTNSTTGSYIVTCSSQPEWNSVLNVLRLDSYESRKEDLKRIYENCNVSWGGKVAIDIVNNTWHGYSGEQFYHEYPEYSGYRFVTGYEYILAIARNNFNQTNNLNMGNSSIGCGINSNHVNNPVAESLLDADTKKLIEASIINGYDLDLTESGWKLLKAMVFTANKAALLAKADEIIAAQKSN